MFISNDWFSPAETPATLQSRAGTWSIHMTGTPNPSVTIPAGAYGRFIRVQLAGTNYLSLAEVQVMGPISMAEDTCQQVNFTYDSNSDRSFTYLAGRLATRSYSACGPGPTGNGVSPAVQTNFTDMFSYTQAGQVTKKRLRVGRQIQGYTAQADLDGTWTYDNEGKMTAVTYPTATDGFNNTVPGRPTRSATTA